MNKFNTYGLKTAQDERISSVVSEILFDKQPIFSIWHKHYSNIYSNTNTYIQKPQFSKFLQVNFEFRIPYSLYIHIAKTK